MAEETQQAQNPEEPVEIAIEDMVNEEIKALLEHPVTPQWIHPLLVQVAEEGHTYRLAHIRQNVQLLIRIMEDSTPAEMTLWIEDEVLPDWMREGVAMYRVEQTRIAKKRVLSDIEAVEELLDMKCGFE